MRSTILAVLAAASLAVSACGGEAPPPAPPPPPPPPPVASAPPPVDTTPPPPPKPALSDLIPAALKGLDDAFNAHDTGKMGGFFTDDAVDYAYGGGEQHGRAAFAAALGGLFGAFPDAKVATTRVWIKGNVAIAELLWNGTMKGDMGPMMKATNKPVGQVRLHIMWFTDEGLVKEMHEYADDAATMMQAMGKKGALPIPTLPTNPAEMHFAKGTPDEDKLVDWAKAGNDVANKDDPKQTVALWADDGDITTGGGMAIKGQKALLGALTGYLKAIPDQKWTTVNAWGIDGFAIVEQTLAGTNKGSMGPGLPPTGKPVTGWHIAEIYQPTGDGKIQHDWAYMNMNEFLAQTGQLKAPGAPPSGKNPAPGGKQPPPAKKP